MNEKHPYFWTVTQLQKLLQAYQSGGGLSEAQSLLPEKSRTTIAAKASRMEITKAKPRKKP